MAKNIAIKNSECCDFCNDDIPHFLLLCPNIKHFRNHGLNGGLVTKTDIRHVDHLQENILFGFVGSKGITDVLNYCILYAKYYIYI